MSNANDRDPAKSTGARLGLGVFVTLMTLGSVWLWQQSTVKQDLVIPELDAREQTGSRVFHKVCAICHGENASGSKDGPPLIHRYYEASLHGDATFYDAVRFGSRAHHWNYGDMPRVDDIPEQEIAAIVAWIRKLQAANGIQAELR